jgi:hypothetical protein
MKKTKTIEQMDDKKISEELDTQEQAMKEILAEIEGEKFKKIYTNPSVVALTEPYKDAGQSVAQVKKTVKQLFILYLTNQFISRAVNVRADTLVSAGYMIDGEDDNGVTACKKLIEDSGGITLLWQLGANTDIAGDGFLEPVINKTMTKMVKLKHVHPMTLTFKTDEQTDRILVGRDKEPIGYVQHVPDENGVEQEKDIPKDKIFHFKFNSLGDEFTGISAIQSCYDTVVRLMNMEYAAAHAAIRTANPLWVAKTNTRSPHQVAQWAQILGKISGKEQLFVPEGMEIDMKSPGQQNFSEYADYFLNAVVSAFGVPKGVLLGGTQGGGNRAQELVLSKHFYNLIRVNQRSMEMFFNKIFEKYAEMAGFKAPKFKFGDIDEDITLVADSTVKLFQSGIIDRDEARMMIGIDKNNPSKRHAPIASEVKKSDMQTWHPNDGKTASGSQIGEKKKMEASPVTTSTPGPY